MKFCLTLRVLKLLGLHLCCSVDSFKLISGAAAEINWMENDIHVWDSICVSLIGLP